MNLPFNIGLPEIAVILGIALLICGPKALPEFGKNFGKGLREFLGSLRQTGKELKEGLSEQGNKKEDKS